MRDCFLPRGDLPTPTAEETFDGITTALRLTKLLERELGGS
jgi:hypothetical protein